MNITRPNAPLIGLGGRLRAGKDEVADHLVAHYGFVKLGMSDTLHAAALVIDPYIPVNAKEEVDGIGLTGRFVRYSEMIERVGYVEAKTNPEVRRFFQEFGTKFGRRMIDENIWVDIVAREITDILDAGHPVVATGIRFPNEIDMIQDMLGSSWWVHRPTTASAVTPEQIIAHESERGVNEADFDKVVRNEGTLDELFATVDLMMAAIFPDVPRATPSAFAGAA